VDKYFIHNSLDAVMKARKTATAKISFFSVIFIMNTTFLPE